MIGKKTGHNNRIFHLWLWTLLFTLFSVISAAIIQATVASLILTNWASIHFTLLFMAQIVDTSLKTLWTWTGCIWCWWDVDCWTEPDQNQVGLLALVLPFVSSGSTKDWELAHLCSPTQSRIRPCASASSSWTCRRRTHTPSHLVRTSIPSAYKYVRRIP